MSRVHFARYLLIAALLPALIVLSPIAFGLVAVMIGTLGLLLGVFGAALGSVAAVIGLMLAFLASCASPVAPPPVKKSVVVPKVDTGLDRMERLALTANRCWFKSRDPAFTGYSLAPELSSFSGRPRFLLVPKGRMEARPLLVVEGRAGSADIEAYGPLLDTAIRARLEGDLARWKAGSGECSA